MKGVGILGVSRRLFAGVALVAACLAYGEEAPAWDFKVKESELAMFEGTQLHAKDGDWLMTCRMRVKSLNLLSPISKLEFKGFDGKDEVVWEDSRTIRRKDFTAAYGGGREQFVRAFLKDVPEEVVRVELHYGDSEEDEAQK